MIACAPCGPTASTRPFRPQHAMDREELNQGNPGVAVGHDPVMVEEILGLLPLRPGAVAADGTLGHGGHSIRFAERIAPGGTLVATDWDREMLEVARRRLAESEGVVLHLLHDDFRNLGARLAEHSLLANGILLDLGLNSAQIQDPERGLSFMAEGPLDMRMDRSVGEPASALLNRWSPDEIERVLWEYGDERWARMIARRIVERRKTTPLRRTSDLVEAVLAAIPPRARDKRIHAATRTFQAVRIAVNRELEGLDEALQSAARSLANGGVLAVLSYHSGEDRIVKRVFRELAAEGFEEVVRKPIQPGEEEVRRNPRSRSAKLRAVRRLAEADVVSGEGRSGASNERREEGA
jgi:16S rRNA (cytosine1402-N4)-methyltransferase